MFSYDEDTLIRGYARAGWPVADAARFMGRDADELKARAIELGTEFLS